MWTKRALCKACRAVQGARDSGSVPRRNGASRLSETWCPTDTWTQPAWGEVNGEKRLKLTPSYSTHTCLPGLFSPASVFPAHARRLHPRQESGVKSLCVPLLPRGPAKAETGKGRAELSNAQLTPRQHQPPRGGKYPQGTNSTCHAVQVRCRLTSGGLGNAWTLRGTGRSIHAGAGPAARGTRRRPTQERRALGVLRRRTGQCGGRCAGCCLRTPSDRHQPGAPGRPMRSRALLCCQ